MTFLLSVAPNESHSFSQLFIYRLQQRPRNEIGNQVQRRILYHHWRFHQETYPISCIAKTLLLTLKSWLSGRKSLTSNRKCVSHVKVGVSRNRNFGNKSFSSQLSGRKSSTQNRKIDSQHERALFSGEVGHRSLCVSIPVNKLE